jgi:hypothetical protein
MKKIFWLIVAVVVLVGLSGSHSTMLARRTHILADSEVPL